MTSANETLRYRVIGMDCAHDAREIEDAARASGAVQNVRVSVSSQILTLQLSPTGAVTDVTDAVNGIGYQLSPLTPTTADAISGSETHKSTAYRNALW